MRRRTSRPTLLLALLLLLAPLGQARAVEAVEIAGNVLQVFLPAVAWAGTYVDEDGEGRDQLYWALGGTVASTLALKWAVDRDGPAPHRREYAFPSEHASVGFSSASFVQRRYGWSYGWPLYAMAAFSGWSRVYTDQNRWDEVLAGAALGVGFSYLFVDPREDAVQVSLRAGPEGYGIGVVARW